jgi:hypothetical protein
MAEVFVQFAHPVIDENGIAYHAQACGARRADGMWDGWIEFVPVRGGEPLRSSRETTQPNRTDTAYWATGLTPVYLEGALARAQNPLIRHEVETAEPVFDGPAPPFARPEAPSAVAPEAILDPFEVYEKGEGLLRGRLGALAPGHLLKIIAAYDLSSEPASRLNRLPATALIEIIISAVRAQMPSR